MLFFFGGWFCHFIFKRDVTRERTPASERGVERNPLGGFAQRRGVRQDVPKTPSDGTLRRRSRGCDEKGAGGEIPLFFFVKKLSLRAAQEEAKVLREPKNISMSYFRNRQEIDESFCFLARVFFFQNPLSLFSLILSAPSLVVIT